MTESIKYCAAPQQGINVSGDCGPCCISGITGIPVLDIYNKYVGRIDGLTYFDVYNLCLKLVDDGIIEQVDNKLPDLPEYLEDPEWNTFGRPSWMNMHNWLNNVSFKVATGWIGIAMVNMRGFALEEAMHANHFVLIIGCQNGESYSDKIVKISCPTLGYYEKPAKDFLKNYGGYNTIWVKPIK